MPAEILLHISVAYEHYRRGRIEKAVADLLTALTDTQKNKGDSPDVRALRYKLHAILLSAYGSLLQERFCFPQRFIDDGPRGPDKKVRDKLRKDAISALEESRAAKYEGWEYKDDGWGSTGLLANLLASSPETDFQTLARALMDVRQALAERPSDVEARLALAALQLRQGELPHALESYEISAILSPLDPRVHYLLGFSMMQNRAELERAIDERKSARDLDPANWDYLGDPLPGCMPIVGWARIQEPPSPNPRVDSRNPRVN